MNSIFTEFENENSQRSYPFASGCVIQDTGGNGIGTGVFIDAVFYPINSTGVLYLSSVKTDSTVNISDDTGVIMTASYQSGSNTLEFYEPEDPRRHVGTLLASTPDALMSFVTVDATRTFKSSATTFASSCVFPIENDGVTSLNIGSSGAIDGPVKFVNKKTDEIRVSTDEGMSKLRFDIIPSLSKSLPSSIKHIYCIVRGKTPFRIEKIPFDSGHPSIGNTICVYLDNIDKSMICSDANRENSLKMVDTCEECRESSDDDDPQNCHARMEDPVVIPDYYHTEVIDVDNGAENAFYLVTPNMTGYANPLSVTLTDGTAAPKTEVSLSTDGNNEEALLDNITSKGAILQVPGLKK